MWDGTIKNPSGVVNMEHGNNVEPVVQRRI